MTLDLTRIQWLHDEKLQQCIYDFPGSITFRVGKILFNHRDTMLKISTMVGRQLIRFTDKKTKRRDRQARRGCAENTFNYIILCVYGTEKLNSVQP